MAKRLNPDETVKAVLNLPWVKPKQIPPSQEEILQTVTVGIYSKQANKQIVFSYPVDIKIIQPQAKFHMPSELICRANEALAINLQLHNDGKY